VAAPGLLASVATLDEIEQALAFGADLIDLKDPSRGALGAWAPALLTTAVTTVGRRRPVSATVGDLAPTASELAAAARRTAATGVDIVKLGFLAGADHRAVARELASVADEGVQLVAVLMADQEPDLALPTTLKEAGFFGVMLDTADKKAGSLRNHLTELQLAEFVRTARRHELFCGLAGSLGLEDIPELVAMRPDYLGFRGALCTGDRAGALDFNRSQGVRRAIDTAAGPAGPTVAQTR
jgi:(5-formylfuran-3-yl)methyl phosphate synthase